VVCSAWLVQKMVAAWLPWLLAWSLNKNGSGLVGLVLVALVVGLAGVKIFLGISAAWSLKIIP